MIGLIVVQLASLKPVNFLDIANFHDFCLEAEIMENAEGMVKGFHDGIQGNVTLCSHNVRGNFLFRPLSEFNLIGRVRFARCNDIFQVAHPSTIMILV